MFVVVLGFRSHSIHADVEVVYCGNCGDEAEAAIRANAEAGFIKMGKLINPTTIPVRIPDLKAEEAEKVAREEAAKKAAEEAEAKAAADAAAAAAAAVQETEQGGGASATTEADLPPGEGPEGAGAPAPEELPKAVKPTKPTKATKGKQTQS